MAKYNNERDFIQKEFMKDLDPTIFILKEDKENFYIVFLKELDDNKTEEHIFITLYKNKIPEIMEKYEKECLEDE